MTIFSVKKTICARRAFAAPKLFLSILFAWNAVTFCTETNVPIYSKSMSKTITVKVFLPKNYASSKKDFPTVYLLHGYGGNQDVWKRVAPLQIFSDENEIIFVCADAKNSWYLDSPKSLKSKYESFFVNELLPMIDSAFQTGQHRNKRAICGISMGGHGALTLIAQHPDLFCAATSICGIMDLSEFPDRWDLASVLGPYEQNQQTWIDHSFISLFKKLKGKNCAIALDCGISDFALPANRKVHKLMTENDIEHDYFERPGTHTLEYPSRVFKYHLLFLLEHFK